MYFKQWCDVSAKYTQALQQVQRLCQSMQCEVGHCLTCGLQTRSNQSGAAWRFTEASDQFLPENSVIILLAQYPFSTLYFNLNSIFFWQHLYMAPESRKCLSGVGRLRTKFNTSSIARMKPFSNVSWSRSDVTYSMVDISCLAKWSSVVLLAVTSVIRIRPNVCCEQETQLPQR